MLFDFDGVIVLSEPLHFAAFAEVLATRGVTLTEQDYYDRYLSFTDREAIAKMVADSGRADLRGEEPALLRAKTAAMARAIERGVPLCPGIETFVAATASRYTLAIVSAAIRVEIETVLEQAKLASAFVEIVAAEDVRAGKPDPQGYRLGVERLRERLPELTPEECLAIEDSPKGVVAAHAAGLRVLALPHTRPRAELGEADFFAESYADVDWRAIESRFA